MPLISDKAFMWWLMSCKMIICFTFLLGSLASSYIVFFQGYPVCRLWQSWKDWLGAMFSILYNSALVDLGWFMTALLLEQELVVELFGKVLEGLCVAWILTWHSEMVRGSKDLECHLNWLATYFTLVVTKSHKIGCLSTCYWQIWLSPGHQLGGSLLWLIWKCHLDFIGDWSSHKPSFQNSFVNGSIAFYSSHFKTIASWPLVLPLSCISFETFAKWPSVLLS